MKTLEKIKIYEKALELYGQDAQFEMTIEESSELILAFQKFKRAIADPHSTEKKLIQVSKDVIDELADVQIMLDQMKLIFGYIEIEKRITFKLNRLVKRMNKD